MIKIKLFIKKDIEELEIVVNEWLFENKNIQVRDVKYQAEVTDMYASILVIYEIDEN